MNLNNCYQKEFKMHRRNYKCDVSINQTLQYKTPQKINDEFKEIHDALVDIVSICEKMRNQKIEDVKKGQPIDSEELLEKKRIMLTALMEVGKIKKALEQTKKELELNRTSESNIDLQKILKTLKETAKEMKEQNNQHECDYDDVD